MNTAQALSPPPVDEANQILPLDILSTLMLRIIIVILEDLTLPRYQLGTL